ncbi:MAG: chemotaxis protein methyltransferase CheR [Candidatus Magnetoglobus multicellularis str. Araruama]|uniref:Chemotaxis protein methyltransferase CheR n=1 Tax=Candidatus Magnetoglobus multicellularis str. Araruama TaxID=890399 RepID=A0A1V1PGH2_9BACT|nr:MAG: chemotaxis protein methyltransferase CheR [Candidatus Magnetoglobus multicellularis str. Araruama]
MIQSLCTWITQKTGHHISQDNIDRVSFVLAELANDHNISEEELAYKVVNGKALSQEFIDQYMTTESYFMRYPSNMKLVARQFIPKLLKAGIKPFILSIPCARGEEPYSLSMILIDEGIALDKVNITAVDISRSCIEQAKKGKFSSYSFRRLPKPYIQRYFTKTGRNTYTIQSDIRSSVQFKQLNILSDILPAKTQKYHVIFCHNLFIYLNPNAINTALNQFDLFLDDDGWLFVDSSEGSHIAHRFKRVLFDDNHFVYVKQQSSKQLSKTYDRLSSYDKHPVTNKIPDIPKKTKTHPNIIKKIHVKPNVQNQLSKHLSHPDDHQINKAIFAYQGKDFSTAAKIFEDIIHQKNSSYASIAHMGLAKINADIDNDLEALENAEMAINLDQDSTNIIKLTPKDKADVFAIIALILQKKGMKSNALPYFEKLKALDDQHPALVMKKG